MFHSRRTGSAKAGGRRRLAAGVGLVMLAACARPAPREAEVEPSVPVLAEPVILGSIQGTVSATGVVSTLPGATYAVTTRQPARIAEITKNVGDEVASGEVLVRLEFPSLRAQMAVNSAAVKAATARVAQASLVQGRIRSLLSRGAAAQRELDDADHEVTVAEAELTVANAAMSATDALGQNATLLAPFNGTVAERLHQPGDLIQPDDNDPILRLIDPKQVQISAVVAPADITRFTIGATARALSAQGAPSQPSSERRAIPVLLRVVSRPDPLPGATSVPITLAFDTPTDLSPGTQVGIEIDAEQRSNVPLVPAIAVLRDAANNAVVVVASGGVAQRRPITTGLEDQARIEIRSGLKAGELVITQGHSSLRDGTPISLTTP